MDGWVVAWGVWVHVGVCVDVCPTRGREQKCRWWAAFLHGWCPAANPAAGPRTLPATPSTLPAPNPPQPRPLFRPPAQEVRQHITGAKP
eukprot:7489264-Prorocentrum_lima.AAC.1